MSSPASTASQVLPANNHESAPQEEPGGRASFWKNFRHACDENRLAVVGFAIIVAVSLFCFVGPLIYRTNQVNPNLFSINEPPSSGHWLGTDGLGFDILGRLMVGGQSSIEIGISVGILATAIGVVWGAISGLIGGLLDSILMRVADVFLAIPTMFIFIFLASVLRPTLILLIVILSLAWWVGPSRLIRGETLSLRTREFVEAVRGMGGHQARIVWRHILPNTLAVIVVQVTFMIADSILVLATLAFLGFGLPPPAVTWGGMLSDGSQYLFAGYWWQIYPAGVIIILTVIAFNFIGDAIRDAFDVRLVQR